MNARKYLDLTVREAKKALDTGNYPFGAVIIDGKGRIAAIGHNENFSQNDISAHAEIQCLRMMDIDKLLDKNKRYFLFCSGEPCGGCSFFIARTKIKYVCWALTDPQNAGFDDFRKDAMVADLFKQITVVEEPFADFKSASALLLQQYYLKIGKPERAELY